MVKAMRKVRTGSVVRTGADKTAVVEMVWKQRHRLYRKQMRRVARFYVHDPLNQCQMGDLVRIQEVRPISKTKRWRLLEILERRQVAEVLPIELEADAQVEEETEEATALAPEEGDGGLAEAEDGEDGGPAVAQIEDESAGEESVEDEDAAEERA
jgi:small subunit ribosomal protein S17